MKGLMRNMLEPKVKSNRFRILRMVPGWLWRLAASALLGWSVFAVIVPLATAQRGYSAIGGEYLAVFVLFMLPLCIFRKR